MLVAGIRQQLRRRAHSTLEISAYNFAENKVLRVVEVGGVALRRSTETTQLTHFTLRPMRQKRPKRQTEVHGGYTEHFPPGCFPAWMQDGQIPELATNSHPLQCPRKLQRVTLCTDHVHGKESSMTRPAMPPAVPNHRFLTKKGVFYELAERHFFDVS
jgi:hypothetical protein